MIKIKNIPIFILFLCISSFINGSVIVDPTITFPSKVFEYNTVYSAEKNNSEKKFFSKRKTSTHTRQENNVSEPHQSIKAKELARQKKLREEQFNKNREQSKLINQKTETNIIPELKLLEQQNRVMDNKVPEQKNVTVSHKSSEPTKNNISNTTRPQLKQSDSMRTGIYIKNVSQKEMITPFTENAYKQEINSIVPEKLSEALEKCLNQTILGMLKKSFMLSPHTKIAQINFTDAIADSLKKMILNLFKIQENFGRRKNNYLNNFRYELQELTLQIQSYNSKTVYNSPHQMLNLIKKINQFIKENNIIFLQPHDFKKLDAVEALANTCSNIIVNQNIILSSKSAPNEIISFFQPIMNQVNAFSNLSEYTIPLFNTIYSKNGLMDQTARAWANFQKSNLNITPTNRLYAAFLTFLLLFEHSLVAATVIIDESNNLYQAANQLTLDFTI